MNDAFAVSIVLFFIGVFLLAAFRRDARILTARWKEVELALRGTEDLFARRAEQLPTLLSEMRYFAPLQSLSQDVLLALKQREIAMTTGEKLMPAEQEISRLLARLRRQLAPTNEDAKPNVALSDLLTDTREREEAIALARERYNEAAEAWNAYQRAFPLGLLARAIEPQPVPLFESN